MLLRFVVWLIYPKERVMKKIQQITALIALLWVVPTAAGATVTVGEAAPDFTLTDSAGESHKLSDYHGKTVVLEWTNHLCPFVRKHYDSGNMQALQAHATEQDVTWLSIISSAPGKQGHVSGEEADDLTESRDAHPSAVLLDESGDVGRLYGARTTPHMYVIDEEGVLVYQGAIDDNNSADPADAATARNYVREALDALHDGGEIDVSSTASYGCSVKY